MSILRALTTVAATVAVACTVDADPPLDGGGPGTGASTGTLPLPSGTGGSGGTDGPSPVPVACIERCAEFEECSDAVHEACLTDCDDIEPALSTFDAGCGDRAEAYFSCAATLSCEQARSDLEGSLDPHPCQELLDDYRTTCGELAPEACRSFCDRAASCVVEPQDDDACIVNCVALHGRTADDDETCRAALDAYIDCGVESSCQEIEAGSCEDEQASLMAC